MMMKSTIFSLAVALTFATLGTEAQAFYPMTAVAAAARSIKQHSQETTDKAPGEAQIETAFSPDGGGEVLVVKIIHSAVKTIRLSAYSFTSPAVVRALIDAKHRGVEVAVVVDYKNNISEDRSGKAKAALNLLVNAGIPTRTISRYPIHHDKFIVSDGLHVETGSFNYSDAAARRNSENVLVVWNNPQVATSYLKHWQSRYEQGADYKSAY
jgi:phosphatidylserine/phosphatidylglycerophosphate/cardiolipin synthase-like enzyme